MREPEMIKLGGSAGALAVHRWPNPDATFLAVVVHGYAEHARRYDHVAARLLEAGGAVYAPDHQGHGLSDGERALVANGPSLTDDLHLVVELARVERPGLPLVMVGHSMGGMIATRYAQLHSDLLGALVLSGPVVGGNAGYKLLLDLDPIPEIPIDPAVLSRDPAVGEAYAEDPLVYSGPFKRPTLEALFTAMDVIAAGPGFGGLPVLWLHGSDDMLAPLEEARRAMEHLRGPRTEDKVYPEARHEIFNETNQDEVLDDAIRFVSKFVPTT